MNREALGMVWGGAAGREVAAVMPPRVSGGRVFIGGIHFTHIPAPSHSTRLR